MKLNTLEIEQYAFKISKATFGFRAEYDGWNFLFVAEAVDAVCHEIFPYGAQIFCEGAPLPLENKEHLTGAEIYLELPYDDETGEPFFDLQVGEGYPLSRLRLRFLERQGEEFLIEIEATAPESVLSYEASVKLLAWCQREKLKRPQLPTVAAFDFYARYGVIKLVTCSVESGLSK